jgi:hypothetical protein
MRKAALGSASVVILYALLCPGWALGERSIAEISRKCAPAVVTILALNENYEPISSGTGFFVNREGHVVTNHHVLAGAFTAIAKTTDQRTGEVLEVIKDDPGLDLLVAKTSLQNTPPLVLGDSDRIRAGEAVFGLANPGGSQVTLYKGVVSAIRKAGHMELIQMTVPVLPGCSGEPIFNLSGEVIGVATAFADLGEDLNFALPLNYLNRLKPVRQKVSALPAVTTRFEATLRNKTLVEVLAIRHSETASSASQEGLTQRESLAFSRHQALPQKKPGPKPGVVYFRNGKQLLCDMAWKRGKTVFLVIHGKHFAVGYDESQIEMKRSFHL